MAKSIQENLFFLEMIPGINPSLKDVIFTLRKKEMNYPQL